MDRRLIELALEALEVRKAALDAEIAKMRSQLGGRTVGAKAPAAKPFGKRRGPQSKSARKAQSDRMKAYWAKRRAEAARKK
jgi:hypothetical protein